MSNQVVLVGNDTQHYQSMRQKLMNYGFYVAYIPQVQQALMAIKDNNPVIVITNNKLQDKHEIFNFSEQMSKRLIPVIFISDTDDRHTFELAMRAGVNTYFVKDRHNMIDIIRQIQLLAQNHDNKKRFIMQTHQKRQHQIGLAGLTTYLQDIKNMGYNDISRKVVRYENIVFISNKRKHIKYSNYIWFKDISGKMYYLKESLTSIYQRLPEYFARLNDSYIVSLLPEYLDGRINGSNIVVNGQRFSITRTYKTEFEKRFAQLYS